MNKSRHLRMYLINGKDRVTVNIDRPNCDGEYIVRRYIPNEGSMFRVTKLLENHNANIIADLDMIYLFTIL